MEVVVSGTDRYGDAAYQQLFEVIMSDIGKAHMIEKAELLLMPETPLFVFSIKLRNAPESVTMKDAASIRSEGKDAFVSISDERYAPNILSQLWKRYGRDGIEQTTRFDITVRNAEPDDLSDIEITSGEAVMKEMIGALWRALPEGIRVREKFLEGNTLTVLATEEILIREFKDKAMEVHRRML